jgi:hypothetical protein
MFFKFKNIILILFFSQPPTFCADLAGKICYELATPAERHRESRINQYAVFFKGHADKCFGVYIIVIKPLLFTLASLFQS